MKINRLAREAVGIGVGFAGSGIALSALPVNQGTAAVASGLNKAAPLAGAFLTVRAIQHIGDTARINRTPSKKSKYGYF